MFRHIVADIETNGLLHRSDEGHPPLDRIHCLAIKCLDTGEVMSCTDHLPDRPTILEGLEVIGTAERIYGHNFIGFDIPAIQRVYPDWTYVGKVFDTLTMVRVRYAHIKEMDFGLVRKHALPSKYIGSQALEAWGWRLGILKGEYIDWCASHDIENPWAEWRMEMQDYVDQDVEVNTALLLKLRADRAFPQGTLDVEMELTWYLTQQHRNGWPFDFERAVHLQGTLAQRREEIGEELRQLFGSWEEKGKLFTPKRDNKTLGYKKGVPVQKYVTKTFNPASRDHIANRLMTLYGWKPTEFTPTGKPKVDEKTLRGLDFPGCDLLVEYLTLDKRLGQLSEGQQAWMDRMEDDRVEGGALTGMNHIHHNVLATTITHRHRHSRPNLGQVPALNAPFGKECRELFTVPEGWKLMGSDMSGLELRCLAHYMARFDNGEYGEVILEGDIHSVNAEALGLERPDAKTWIYAYLYGAGDVKLGFYVDPLAPEAAQRANGKRLRAQFEERIPALGRVVNGVKDKVRKLERARKAPYLNLIDGRRAYVRSPHSALNTLLQGTGSVACKFWIVEFRRRMLEEYGPQGWEGDWAALAWVHDEIQVAVREEHAEDVGRIAVASAESVTDTLGFRIPLTGEYQIGDNWRETH